jgi:hypothetical protein
MLPFTTLIVFASTALSLSLDSLASRKSFTLTQTAVNRTVRHPVHVVREAYLKYNIEVPEEIEQAAYHVDKVQRLAPPGSGQTTVIAKTIRNDLQYLIEVKVGKHDLMLDLDTGSSDL